MAREQIRVTEEEFLALREEMGRILFIQYGMRNHEGVRPTWDLSLAANGITRDLTIFLENMMTEKVYGQTEAQARKSQ